ncbi:MAG TPA: hypothetical protein VMF61_05180 [Candidatus Acidoferrales bacterium]|nr:hypothetical protein [Candidatus Acidoferrales bacterium]
MHGHVMSLPVAGVVRELTSLLGLTLVAAIGGVGETRAVSQWTNGRRPQRPHVLRFALQLARMLADDTGPEAARAWFLGSNPHLGDRSPVSVLRISSLEEAQHDLMVAARAFLQRAERTARVRPDPTAG